MVSFVVAAGAGVGAETTVPLGARVGAGTKSKSEDNKSMNDTENNN